MHASLILFPCARKDDEIPAGGCFQLEPLSTTSTVMIPKQDSFGYSEVTELHLDDKCNLIVLCKADFVAMRCDRLKAFGMRSKLRG